MDEYGIWGERRRRYLRNQQNGIYTGMLLSGRLDGHLTEINQQAKEMYARLIEQMAKQESITEQLKADDQMEWVQRMSNIQERAMEIVNTELIYA